MNRTRRQRDRQIIPILNTIIYGLTPFPFIYSVVDTNEAIKQMLRHHRTLVDDRGNVLCAIGPDLWAVIQHARRRFLIDTNYPWRQHLTDESNWDCAFILGATIQNEMDSATAALFDGAGKHIVAHNFFLFTCSRESPCWAIDRMDEQHHSIYKQDGLTQDPKSDPPISLRFRTGAESRELQDETKYLLTDIRRELVSLLQRPKGTAPQQLLIQEVRNQREICFKEFFKARDVARRCYAALLINDRSARKDYQDKQVNGLEDSVLIGEALFLNAEILSCNGHVKTMGQHYCQIPVYSHLSQHSNNSQSQRP